MNESQNKVIDKIEKLLALAGSDHENEAKARRKNGRSFTILRRRSAMIGVK